MAYDGNKAEISSFLNSLSSHPAEAQSNKAQNHSCPTSFRPSILVEDQSFTSLNLKDMLAKFDRPHNWSLVKVPHQLRQVNEKAYEPQLISIGLYHRGKSHLTEMEVYKKQCLKRICDEKGTDTVARCIQNMDIEKARKCYSPSLDLELQMPAFVEMMLLDGCLVVELLCWNAWEIDPIFDLHWVLNGLFHDMLLLENQLPFFVLVNLYRMIKGDGKDFASQAFSVLGNLVPGPKKWIDNLPTIKDTGNIKHLLSLVHDNWSPSLQGISRHQEYCRRKREKERAREEVSQDKWKFKLLAVEKGKAEKFGGDEESGVTKGEHSYFKWNFICCAREKQNVRKGRMGWKSIRCATELQQAGIHFQNVWVQRNGKSTEDSNVKSLFDISFTNGTMKIPTFLIHDHTERLFRNLIAYEQYDQKGPTYVTDYVTLMDYLINSGKDVQLLRHSEIIENMLGDDEVVAQMINKLGSHVTFSTETFYYKEIFDNVGKHCKRRWPKMRAKLMHDYFNSPWALISFLAATLIILLTIAQTVFSALSH